MKSAAEAPLRLVLIGGSSGSFSIFEDILKMLRSPLTFSMVFVLHRGKTSSASLPDLFRSKTQVPMKEPYHLDPIETNHIYFAFPDYHLLIGPDRHFYYDRSEKDFFSRPSIDTTFISAAVSGIPVKAAMLFSGSSADGARGLKLLQNKGFPTYVQDPAFAGSARMPREALAQCDRHTILREQNYLKVINDILFY